MTVLVDSSAWIDVIHRGSPDVRPLLRRGEVRTCAPVVQEVLQGFRDEARFRLWREVFRRIPCLDEPLGLDVFHEAVTLYRAARRAGLTPRSSVDCLIAASAIRHGAEVWHRDRDFTVLARISPLRQRPV